MENPNEMLSRVQMMAAGDDTWDLSDNDKAALKWLLADRESAAKEAVRLGAESHELSQSLAKTRASKEIVSKDAIKFAVLHWEDRKVLEEIQRLALTYPGGPDENADASNERPEDAGAHVAGLILKAARQGLVVESVLEPEKVEMPQPHPDLERVRRIWLEWREKGIANAIAKGPEYMAQIGKVVEPDYPTERLRDDAFGRLEVPPTPGESTR